MDPDQLRAEIEDLQRSMPDQDRLKARTAGAADWVGRFKARISQWNLERGAKANQLAGRSGEGDICRDFAP